MKRLLLRLYPAEWRRRYGDEVDQLVEDLGLGPAVAFDLARSGLFERSRSIRSSLTGGNGMILGPAYRHPRGLALLALLLLAPTLLFVLGSLLAYQLGVDSMRSPMDAANQWLFGRRFLDVLLVLSPAAALLLAVAPLVRLELKTGEAGREAVVGVRLRIANVLVGLTALAIGGVLVWYLVFESVVQAGA